MNTFKKSVLHLLVNDCDLFAEWKKDLPDDDDRSASRASQLGTVLQVLAATIKLVEELDDGPPIQDAAELAHNELDRYPVKRSNPQGLELPLWFRIRALALLPAEPDHMSVSPTDYKRDVERCPHGNEVGCCSECM